VSLPAPLKESTKILARLFDYELLPELPAELVWLSRIHVNGPPVVTIHDFTGMLWAFKQVVENLHAPCLGIQCSTQLIGACRSMQDLAWRYIRLLPLEVLHGGSRLLAYSLGCRIAFRMACALDSMDKSVHLVLLDGPVGPSSIGPPRMGGLASTFATRLRSRVKSCEMDVDAPSMCAGTPVHTRPVDPLDAEVERVASAGQDTAMVAASLLELPDDDDLPSHNLLVPSLYISAEASANRTNGTVDTAEVCLPCLRHVTVCGGHFDFLQKSNVAISMHVNNFFGLDSKQRE